MQKLLSICIPTFNRAERLEQCLFNLSNILNELKIKNLVDVLISDNASTDNTYKIVKKFSEFKYFRQDKNFGYDMNVFFLYTYATSKYVLFMADDDFLLKNGFQKLLNLLATGEYETVVCNFCIDSIDGKQDALPFHFLSSFVIPKKNIIKEKVSFETYYMPTVLLLYVLNLNSKVYFMKDFLIQQIHPNKYDKNWQVDNKGLFIGSLGYVRLKKIFMKKYNLKLKPFEEFIGLSFLLKDELQRNNEQILKKFINIFGLLIFALKKMKLKFIFQLMFFWIILLKKIIWRCV